MLEDIEDENDLTVIKCRSILDAVHQEGYIFTGYSVIFDLKNSIIYLYYLHNYDEVIKLNLEEEFSEGSHSIILSDLFSEESKITETPVTKSTETPTSTPSPIQQVTQTTDIDMNIIAVIVICIIVIPIAAWVRTRTTRT
jgi:hypothetical protein